MAEPLNGAETLYVLGQNPANVPSPVPQFTRVRDVAGAPKFVNAAVTAAGTTQGTATVLTAASLVNVTTGTSNQGVLLPASAGLVGKTIQVYNFTGAALKIYPNGTETIDGGSASAAVTLSAANRGVSFLCLVAGNWISALIGAVSS